MNSFAWAPAIAQGGSGSLLRHQLLGLPPVRIQVCCMRSPQNSGVCPLVGESGNQPVGRNVYVSQGKAIGRVVWGSNWAPACVVPNKRQKESGWGLGLIWRTGSHHQTGRLLRHCETMIRGSQLMYEKTIIAA